MQIDPAFHSLSLENVRLEAHHFTGSSNLFNIMTCN